MCFSTLLRQQQLLLLLLQRMRAGVARRRHIRGIVVTVTLEARVGGEVREGCGNGARHGCSKLQRRRRSQGIHMHALRCVR